LYLIRESCNDVQVALISLSCYN